MSSRICCSLFLISFFAFIGISLYLSEFNTFSRIALLSI
nr:MAG TPA: hypothetical protein [Caudoviricetes sp.]